MPYPLRERDKLDSLFEYPGQPLLIALLITRVFPNASAALRYDDIHPAAVASSEIFGSGDMVYNGCDVIRHYQKNRDMEAAIAIAHDRWQASVGPGTSNHETHFLPGIEKAKKLEEEFRKAFTHWDWS